ncbi:6-phospho-beta-glucosidase [Clostridium vincentii]|uniref:Putative 6-phospho-beta-glucosidase n=1 Tax=Clostridium vincentii TaxID=52704 RepID=A0A2T0BIQ2_9CLOT|nr:6-phospho-beta-glucosidase [Clostridium vincentii]PRR83775.1 putative 6-phospho-beta-glucosidase [Clostridium vincentii]
MKKKAIKIVTIGGGSSYTPELMEGFIKRYEELPIQEIWLVDIEEGREKLEIVGAMAQRMWDASPYDVKVHLTLDRREALPGADFVTTQFRVGLLDARIKDERIPFSHGMLGQETNGAGGMFKALRTIPVILNIVEDMKELCPNAWLINFTNPSGMVTQAVIKYGKWKKCIGLCNVPVGALIKEPEMFGVTERDLVHQFAGLNHFHWHKVTDAQGNDLTDQIIDKMYVEDSGTPANIHDVKFLKEQVKEMQLIPCGYHRYYYMQDEMLTHGLEEFNGIGTRGEQVKVTEAELLELYKDPNLNYKPEQLTKRGGTHYSDAACECINSIYNDKRTHMVVSTENNGAITELPYDSIVEISCIITGKGAMPLTWGKFKSAERGWVQSMKAMEECVIESAVTGNYGLILQAFLLNLQVKSGACAQELLDELLVAHKKYLPQFAKKIEELEATGVASKDAVVMDLMVNGH